MKILIISKKNMLCWADNITDAFIRKNHKVENFFINELGLVNNIKRNFLKVISKDLMYASIHEIIEKKIKFFKPDLIIVISPFMFNNKIINVLNNFPNILKFAWVGDKFGEEHKDIANNFDKLFCTDTSFIEISNKLLFPPSIYLPLAVNERVFFNKNINRQNNLLFIASYTKERMSFLNNITSIDTKLIGPKWSNKTLSEKINYKDKILSINDVSNEYNNSKFILNIKHEHNVLNGLNMRTFEAIASGACLIQDYVKDVELNFEISKDIVVYKNLEELNELILKLQKDKKLFNCIINNGEKLVSSNHTYMNRVDKIMENV